MINKIFTLAINSAVIALLSCTLSGSATAQCPTCFKDQSPIKGHGAHSGTDPRRVIYVKIDSSWSTVGTENSIRIENAQVPCDVRS